MAEVLVGMLVSSAYPPSSGQIDIGSEILFNPFKDWFRRGPITKLFRTFIWSNMAPHSKFGILAYIFSYYAISSAWVCTIISFVLICVFGLNDSFCKCYSAHRDLC
jgi:hypothetical protein